jgi:hypothetical protein
MINQCHGFAALQHAPYTQRNEATSSFMSHRNMTTSSTRATFFTLVKV